ncbi:MAG TPA: nuclear transport factor 2 family protein [Gaiella sp.]|nr:nuclear transport factor 2 family protein [Gaiella sp.]
MDTKEGVLRAMYDARARRDWDGVRLVLADEVSWHEPGQEDHSGDFHGRDEVVALLERLVVITEGTFQLEPEAFLHLDRHSAAVVRWSAERGGRRSAGREIGVYRFEDGRIAEVWFFNEVADPDAFSAVFAFE